MDIKKEQADCTVPEPEILFAWVERLIHRHVRHAGFRQRHFEDLRGEAFIALTDCLNRFDAAQGVPFQCFAFTRIKGALIDYIRRECKSAYLLDGDDTEFEAAQSAEADPHEAYQKKEIRSVLNKAFYILPEQHKEVIEKRYVHDMPFKSLSSESRATAFKRHKRALVILKDYISEQSDMSQIEFIQDRVA